MLFLTLYSIKDMVVIPWANSVSPDHPADLIWINCVLVGQK
jgi:hypothetical protein